MTTDTISIKESLQGLVVGTMCHCDDPEDCFDHWQFFIVNDPDSVPESGHVGRGRTLSVEQMRYMVEAAKDPGQFVSCFMAGQSCEPCPGVVGHGGLEW